MTARLSPRPSSPGARQQLRPLHRTAQRGAALLLAMIIMALITTLAAGMVWQQWRAIQVETAERAQVQAHWILLGALDWSRLILREDARTNIDADHLGEPWAVPLAEARLSTFLAVDRDNSDDAPDAFLSGAIQDAQARYNLRNLVQRGKLVAAELKTLQLLCQQVGLNAMVATQLGEALRLASPNQSNEAQGGSATSSDLPLMPTDADQLGWLGLDRATVARLRPYVTLLPQNTPVNLNTASRQVLVAVLQSADLAGVERLVQGRQSHYLRSVSDATPLLGTQVKLDPARVGVKTQYFEVTGALRRGALVVAERSLIERRSLNDIRILRTVRVPAAELVTPADTP